jgi:hypothetical protein
MEQYGAHVLATVRRVEFAAEAAGARRAAEMRSLDQLPSRAIATGTVGRRQDSGSGLATRLS